MKIGLSQLPGRCPFRSNWRLPKRESVFSVVGGGGLCLFGFCFDCLFITSGFLKAFDDYAGSGGNYYSSACKESSVLGLPREECTRPS